MLPPVKKSAQFKRLLPKIEKLLNEGYTYTEVSQVLSFEHGLKLSRQHFGNYLSRYRDKKPQKQTKKAAEIIVNPKTLEPLEKPVQQLLSAAPVVELEVLPTTKQDNLKLARERLAQEQQKLNLKDLLGAV